LTPFLPSPLTRIHKLSLCVLTAAALIGCQAKPSLPVLAPDFELTDLNGHKVNLASFRGHPVLLDFWATWCGPCQMSIPMVQRFYLEHKDQGLVVLGLNVDDDPSGVYPFVKQFQMTYPVLYAGGTPVSDAYQVEGIPTFIFIDPQGRVVRRFGGFRFDMVKDWEIEFQRLKAATP
jgi:thiol-disulfide isomerase/thioredoxin